MANKAKVVVHQASINKNSLLYTSTFTPLKITFNPGVLVKDNNPKTRQNSNIF